MDTSTQMSHGIAEIWPDVRLHYTVAGDGPAVVLIHGCPQNWRQWRHVIGPLVGAGFRVVAPDYCGAGKSTRPTGGRESARSSRR